MENLNQPLLGLHRQHNHTAILWICDMITYKYISQISINIITIDMLSMEKLKKKYIYNNKKKITLRG